MSTKRRTVSVLSCVSGLVIASAGIRYAHGATAAVPTAGLAVTSIVVGGAGVLGGGWKTRLAGFVVGVVDPDPGTFYQGKIVLTYPEDLLELHGVGWFGNFSADPKAPVPPVILDPFFEYDDSVADPAFLLGPNPVLGATVTDSGGVITIEFDASPDGVTVDGDAHFNLLSVMFQNISGQELIWREAGPGNPPNFFSSPEQQILTCKPDLTFPNPVTCGVDTAPFQYHVCKILDCPAVSEWGVLLLALLLAIPVVIAWRQKRSRERSPA